MFARDHLGAANSGLPQTHTYTTGSGMETVPASATTCVIEVWGGAGGGSSGWGSGASTTGGGGGASGGYSKTSVSVTAGKTLTYSVGAPGAVNGNAGNSSVSAGTQALTTMTSNGGTGSMVESWTYGEFSGTFATQSTGGTASGGTVTNTTGNSGVIGSYGGPGTGGAGIGGTNGAGGNGGTGGYGFAQLGTSGGNGLIIFTYT